MAFDASKHLVKLKGKDYLEVKFRLQWLRDTAPDAEIVTTLLEHDPEKGMAVVHAHVRIPGKGAASGLGSETRHDFNDYLEKAETKAIGRALGALGFGTQFCDDFDMPNADGTPHVVDSPVQRTAPTPPQGQPMQRMAQPQSQQAPPANGATGLISPAQIGLVRSICNGLKSDPEVHAQGMYGKALAHLTKREASELIDGLKALASESQ